MREETPYQKLSRLIMYYNNEPPECRYARRLSGNIIARVTKIHVRLKFHLLSGTQ